MSILKSNSADIRSISIAGLDHYARTWMGQWKRFILAHQGKVRDSNVVFDKLYNTWPYAEDAETLFVDMEVRFRREVQQSPRCVFYPEDWVRFQIAFRLDTDLNEVKKEIYKTVKEYVDFKGWELKDIFFGYSQFEPKDFVRL